MTPAGEHNPGETITVVNATDGPSDQCPPAADGKDRTISVDILTSSDRLVSGPHTAKVSSTGRWSVPVVLEPDLAPGGYKANASCYDADNFKVRTYDPATFTIRLQAPGPPSVQPVEAMSGESVQVSSGSARCAPPQGAGSTARVRASILDAGGNTRAEGEGKIAADGSWSVPLRVPDVPAQEGSATAVCLARVGAPAPYARYAQSKLTITAPPPPSTTTTAPPPSTTLAPGVTAPPPTPPPAPTTTRGPVPKLPGFTSAQPPSPTAQPITAEPTYTG